jgi:hypothetical protein
MNSILLVVVGMFPLGQNVKVITNCAIPKEEELGGAECIGSLL